MNIALIDLLQDLILRGQKEYEGIKLPSPQTNGTNTQRQAYAKQCATKIYNNYFKK